MKRILETYKPLIDQRLVDICQSASDTNVPWAEDVAIRLSTFCRLGKTVRGSLLLFTVDLFQPHGPESVDIATTIELLHAALLVHDDVVDHDEIRRGKPSIHAQYTEVGKSLHVVHSEEFGKGMAVCVGDIAIFGAFSFLANIVMPLDIKEAITKTITQEYLTVGFGELHDIALGNLPTIPTAKEVLDMYHRKTARYTFALPMMLGCILTKQAADIQNVMEQLGEALGLLFQIRDDQLTIYGQTTIVGKKVGNDISENKNTLYRVLLFERMDTTDQERVKNIFGNKNINDKEITVVKNLIHKYHVDTDIESQIQTLIQKSETLIASLLITTEQKGEFLEILRFLKERST